MIPFMTLSYYVAFWLLFRSIMSIGVSFEQQSPNIFGWEWLLIFVVGNMAFAFIVFTNIVLGDIETLNIIAIACIVFGFFRVVMAMGLKQMVPGRISNH